MLRFDSVRVESFDLDTFTVSWVPSFNPPDVDLSRIQFYVERSNAQEGPYDTLTATPLVDVFTYTDRQVNRLHKWRRFFYRIRAVDNTVTPPEETLSVPTTVSMRNLSVQERELVEIRRMERILLSGIAAQPGFIGNKCILFPHRSFGQRCTVCWDYEKSAVRSSNCDMCFGTGFKGGFFNPVVVHLNFSPSTESRNILPSGEIQLDVVKAWTSNYPVITRDDLVVDQENRRYRVDSKTQTALLRVTSRQMLTLNHLEPGHIEYKVPFDVSLLD